MKKERKLEKWIEKYFGEQVEIRMKMTRMIFVMIFIGLIIDLLFNFFAMQQRGMNLYVALLGLVSVVLAFFVSERAKNVEGMVFVILVFANMLLFPVSFLAGGGAESGEPMWMLMGILLSCLLLNGWRLYVLLTGSVAAILTAYWISYQHPEIYGSLKGLPIMQINSVIGLFTMSMIIGFLFRYQNRLYDKQRKLAEQRSREVEAISDSKSLFFANMSHEIRTPINTIIGLNEMILREDVSDEIAENAINIQNASKILLALINDILDLSKIESGKMDITPAQYETASMFSDLVNIIWVRASQKQLDFKIDIAEDIPSMLYGDEVRIKQVLTNILTNAVKYTEKGSVTLTVTGEQLGENLIRLKIAVEDTGIGIRKENLEDLFTVFKRVDLDKTKKIEGTGLGLSISKQLVEMMGGTIKVDSIYQKGSCFTIILDQQIVDRTPLGSMRYAAKRSIVNRDKYNRSFEAPDARILVVDDNEMNRMVVRKLLRDTKVQLDMAASGKECLEKTKENSYHVILMDHMMPEMDGEETLGRIRSRQDGYCQKTPVVALTANVMTNASKVYREKGFDGYLAKPISGALLEATLLKFLPRDLVEYQAKASEQEGTPEYSSMMFHNQKKKIIVCADCVCDLPQEWTRKYDIKLMYYYITTEEGRFIDTREIGSTELMEYLAAGKSALSAAAPLEEYEAFFSDRLMEAEQVVFLTVASELNNKGYESAFQAARNFDNVTVINSGHLSSGMGIMVLHAAQMAQDGASVEEIVQEMSLLKEKVSTTFVIQTVDNMYQNHRISKNVRDISKLLQLHPILKLYQNKIVVGGFAVGSQEQAAKKYIRRQLRHRKKIDKSLAFVTYVGLNVKQLEMIREEILKYVPFETIRFQKASATVSSYCGVGTFGVLFEKK